MPEDTRISGNDEHLWGPEHPYYASRGNYFSNECHVSYRSWAAFIAEQGNDDPDMNLVYRWDWDLENRTLELFYVGQRKALHRSVDVLVLETDEPVVREWLEKRAETIIAMWRPISLAEREPADA